MKVLKWMLYIIGIVLLIGVSQRSVAGKDQPLLVWLSIGIIVLGWWIGKKQKEDERQERRQMEKERRQAQQAEHPYSPPAWHAYIPDPDIEDKEEEPDYESAAFLQYPIGDYYGDLSDEDDERLENIDPIERDSVIEKERLFWDMITFDDDDL